MQLLVILRHPVIYVHVQKNKQTRISVYHVRGIKRLTNSGYIKTQQAFAVVCFESGRRLTPLSSQSVLRMVCETSLFGTGASRCTLLYILPVSAPRFPFSKEGSAAKFSLFTLFALYASSS